MEIVKDQYYAQFLPGITQEMPEAFWKLAQLISQHQFEWLEDGRVVYLMNDAVESFIVFQEYKKNGDFDEEYEGDIEANLYEKGEGYLLSVRQGEQNVVTILFHDLKLETHLYNYGETGHFWVEKHEDIRQLEYRLAILRDKIYYLGDTYGNEEERQLAKLYDFPPIMTWYAVPMKYMTPREDPWKVTAEAIEVMKTLAAGADDRSLRRMLCRYQKYPGKFIGKRLANLLTKPAHKDVLVLLARKLQEGAKEYANRFFGTELDAKHQKLWEKGLRRKEQLNEQGIYAEVLREEPFMEAPDDLTYKVYVMCVKAQRGRKKIEIERIES